MAADLHEPCLHAGESRVHRVVKTCVVGRGHAIKSRSCGQRCQQGGRVVGVAVHFTVDEQSRSPPDLTRRQPALDIAAYSSHYRRAGAVAVELRQVELELGGVPTQVVALERRLVIKEQAVHLPEAVLEPGRFGCGSRGERVRMDPGQWKVTECEPDAIAESSLDALDVVVRLSRVGHS
jgi:hypothetical protein